MNTQILFKKIWGKVNPLRYWDLLISPMRDDDELIMQNIDFPQQLSEKLCIFSSFNKKEVVSKSVYFQLKALQKEGFNIIFVSTSKLPTEDIETLGEFCSKVVIKQNEGYDWGAYLTGIRLGDIENRNQLLLINDSIYGPLFPLSQVFSQMSEKGFGCWGITDSYEKKYHLQSYFLCLNSNLLHSVTFKSFCDNFIFYSNRLNVIKKYELGFSQYLIKNAFKLGAYIPYKKICWPPDKKKLNQTHFFWKELIINHRMPFIKKDLLLKNPMRVKNHSEWRQIIQNHTEFDITLI
ncbi:rhamnan synthesis F family protein [Lentisphaerota bacterium ZTH]|nr:hypothetical protein JYG24_08860 [Lentisphaerota bacterium]WET06396.1 rhamnan synthesis F family protein [Lentisphaerota bacterium ZTH]